MSIKQIPDAQHKQTANRRDFLKQAMAGTGLVALLEQSHLLAQPTSDVIIEALEGRPMRTASAMAIAGEVFFNSLSAEQQALASIAFDDGERQEWFYVPRLRKGIPYKQLDQAQRQLANALLNAGLSQQGFLKAATIMSLEPVLREMEQGALRRDAELYYFSLFGSPASSKPWGWRVEGHHISLNFTIVGDTKIASTPSFFGANPAEVRHGPRKGLRALHSEEDLARTLLQSLDGKQRSQAILSESAPGDILSTNSRKADPIKPPGLQANHLSGRQAELLMRLLNEYADNMASDIAAARMNRLRSAGFNQVHFAWAGPVERGQPHYYRIQGPTFLIEYDNVQNNANHIHSVWRDFNGDFGLDLLAEHYKNAHR
jgi:hypothetical protein